MKRAVRPTTQQAITDAAIAALAQNPQATMSEIALRAGVGRATLHRLYASRAELMEHIIVRSMAETEQAVRDLVGDEEDPLKMLQAMFAAVVPLGDRYHFLRGELTTNPALVEQYAVQVRWIADLVDGLKREKLIDHGVPTSWVTAQIDQLIWTAWQEVAGGRLAAVDAPALAVRTVLHGLGPKFVEDHDE